MELDDQLSAFHRLLQRIAGSRAGNPAQLPALALVGADLPDVGAQSVAVLTLANDQVVGGGSIVLRSPYAWATWTIEESRDSAPPVRQFARTGPFCADVVHVSSAATVRAEVARYWTPAVDPIVDALTGVVTSQTPDAGLVVPKALSATYLPGVTPAQLRRAPWAQYFATTASPPTPVDSPAFPAGLSAAAYPVDLYRKVTIRTNQTAFFNVFTPTAGAIGTWNLMQAPIGPATEGTLYCGPWGGIFVFLVPATTTNGILFWES